MKVVVRIYPGAVARQPVCSKPAAESEMSKRQEDLVWLISLGVKGTATGELFVPLGIRLLPRYHEVKFNEYGDCVVWIFAGGE